MRYLYFNDEESDESKIIGDIMQLSFNGMAIEEIEKEYGQVERIVSWEEAIVNECKDKVLPNNVFDLKNENKAYITKNELIGKL